MKSEQWQRLRTLFEQAIELPTVQQRQFLVSNCDDPAVVQDVLQLLAEDAMAGGFLGEPALGTDFLINTDELLKQDEPDDRIGTIIGHYRIIKRIAVGGMGAIYLASRSDQEYDSQVALKVMRPGLNSAQFLQRFLHERQTLANLNHPNIARLVDGGRTPDGIPYLLMEYVDGIPIDVYCDQEQLTVNQRLELFRTVCAAVHFAHRNLIIHRDIKPSNILVTREGVPKLLDFGIATVRGPAGADHAVTRGFPTAASLLTPEFASPEQIRGETVTTSTDVYSLGVVLYVLLTGQLPYTFTGSRLVEFEHTVTNVPPLKPSTAIGKSGVAGPPAPDTDPERISAARRTSPERLRRQLRGDLDNIIMMALRKEPQRRYESAEQFSADIGRFLRGLPVIARHDTLAYRTIKFVRRNYLGVAAAVGIVLALSTGIVATAWQANLAFQQAEHARIEAESAQRSADFLIKVFQQADPRIRGSQEVTARELLDRAANNIAFELRDQPHLRANLADTLGRVYMNLGAYEPAQRLIDEAAEIRTQVFGDRSEEAALSLTSEGELAYAQGRFADAEAAFRKAVDLHRSLKQGVHVNISLALNNLGAAISAQGRFDEAAAIHQEAWQIRRAQFGERSLEAAESLNNLSRIAMVQGRYAQAESNLRQVLDIRQSLLGEHPDVAQAMNNLATVLQHANKAEEALPLYEASIEQFRKLYGRHPDLARTLNSLGATLLSLDRTDEAASAFEESLQMKQELLPPEHPSIATTLTQQAKVDRIRGNYAEGEQRLERAAAIQRAALGEDHPDLAATLVAHAQLLAQLGRHDQAIVRWEQSLRIYEKSLPPEHWFVGSAKAGLAESLNALDEHDRAAGLAKEAHEILLKSRGESDPATQSAADLLKKIAAAK